MIEDNGFDWKNNSIDMIKMLASISVAAVHWTKVGIVENPEPLMGTLRQIFLAIPSVVMFFVISGYLAAVSVEKYSKKDYIINRFLRIYPPLWISVVFNIIVLSVIWWSRIDRSFISGVIAEFLGIAYTPACLKGLPTGSMAGALWTVMVQSQFYVLICLLNPFLRNFTIKKWSCLLISLMVLNVICGMIPAQGVIGRIIERTVFPYLVWFMFGVFSFRFRCVLVPKCKKIMIPSICVMCLYILCGRPLGRIGYYADVIVTMCSLPMTIGLIYAFGKVRIKKEFSISIFLYHWTILNVFSVLGLYKTMGVFQGLILYLGAVAIISYIMNEASSKFVKPILRGIQNRKRDS